MGLAAALWAIAERLTAKDAKDAKERLGNRPQVTGDSRKAKATARAKRNHTCLMWFKVCGLAPGCHSWRDCAFNLFFGTAMRTFS